MKNLEKADSGQNVPGETAMMMTTEDGELIWLTEGDAPEAGGGAQMVVLQPEDGAGKEQEAQIVVLETDDGQQQIQLVTGDGGEVLTLPPELADRLKEGLSGLSGPELGGIQQLIVTDDDAATSASPGAGDGPAPASVTFAVPEDQDVTLAQAEDPSPLVKSEDPDVSLGELVDEDVALERPGAQALLSPLPEEDAADGEEREDGQGAREDMFALLDVEEVEEAPEEELVEEMKLASPEDDFSAEFHPVITQGTNGDEAGEDGEVIKMNVKEEDATDQEWITVTSASGTELKIRMPSVTADGGGADHLSNTQFRVVMDQATPAGSAERPARTVSPEPDWAARTRRRASRGIARAVAALKRAEDSEEEFEEEPMSPPPPPLMATAGGQEMVVKRGRGRPRIRPLPDPPEGGQASEGGEGGGAARRVIGLAEVNVDIIASKRRPALKCDHCPRVFFTEDEKERHAEVHVQETEPEEMADPCWGNDGELRKDTIKLEAEAEIRAELVAEDLEEEDVELEQTDLNPVGHTGVVDTAARNDYEMKNVKKCDMCRKSFTTLASLENHRQRAHTPDGGDVPAGRQDKTEFECATCYVTYTSYKIAERHRQLHQDTRAGRLPHACERCGRAFLTSQLLLHHTKRFHPEHSPPKRRPGDGPRRPSGRPPGSSDKRRQAVYDQIRELTDGSYSCLQCNMTAVSKSKVFYHVSMYHEALRGHVCDVCDKTFFTETALRIHHRTHTGERPFSCELCPRRFRQQADLSSHIMSLHTNERPFKCPFCDKSFTRKYSRTIHMRCHTNERNYKCSVCNKGFRASTYLTAHMKIHTGEKSHACPICQKSFRMRSDMKRHIFTHSRDKPSPRSLRALTMGGAEQDSGVVLLDSAAQICLQLVTDENGEQMVITGNGDRVDLDGAEAVIDEQTGQLMVPETEMEYDETAMASMYLMAENEETITP